MSTIFSQHTQNLLNDASFGDLDTAEKRLSMAGFDAFQAYLKTQMTPQERAFVDYLDHRSQEVQS